MVLACNVVDDEATIRDPLQKCSEPDGDVFAAAPEAGVGCWRQGFFVIREDHARPEVCKPNFSEYGGHVDTLFGTGADGYQFFFFLARSCHPMST